MKLFGKYGAAELKGFSVREIKFARARLGVLEQFASALQTTSYADIRIKDLSRACEISAIDKLSSNKIRVASKVLSDLSET